MPWGEKGRGEVLRAETTRRLSSCTKLALTLIKIFVSWLVKCIKLL